MSGVGDGSEGLVTVLRRHLPDREIGREVAEILARADRAIDYYAPICWHRGACCHFGEAGHRLFVTVPELIHFGQTHAILRPDSGADVCPHQREGRCQARRARPLGCRVYFCQASARWWQPGVSEHFLSELRTLSQRLGIPYAYLDWLVGLHALGGVRSFRR